MQDNQVMLSGALQSELLELIKGHEQIKSLRTGCLSWQGATDLLRSTLDNTVLKSLIIGIENSEYGEGNKTEFEKVLEQNENLTTCEFLLLIRKQAKREFSSKMKDVTNRNKLMKKRRRFRTVKVAPPEVTIGTKRREKDWDEEEQGQTKSSKN